MEIQFLILDFKRTARDLNLDIHLLSKKKEACAKSMETLECVTKRILKFASVCLDGGSEGRLGTDLNHLQNPQPYEITLLTSLFSPQTEVKANVTQFTYPHVLTHNPPGDTEMYVLQACALYADPLSRGLSHAMIDLIIENDPFALKQQRGATERPIRSFDHIHGTEHDRCQTRDCFQSVLFRADTGYKAK
ncbi:hypothetical protein Q7C36_020921 [Tachysurus vachellii]|uniref:Uncharacterized protein n=1 Tax=Tachysurus vachellii TaxID=175792 RepID=A0AA88JBR7_TACVA|nr:hypothetical protein Q7C36_020921 [Tachysurus vachellii]